MHASSRQIFSPALAKPSTSAIGVASHVSSVTTRWPSLNWRRGRVKPAVRDYLSEAGDDFEYRVRAIEREAPIVVLHVDVIGHQASERFKVLRVVSRDPAVRDLDWISRFSPSFTPP